MACRESKYLLILALLSAFLPELKAYLFQVGGKDGWVVSPSENYNHWAGRMRFQVNDTLLFKYKKGTDSVLEVNQGDYSTCNTQNPITKMDGGDSFFKFKRSGPFFFISGMQDHCQKGQKIIIVVMAVRNKSPPGAPAATSPAPSPGSTSSQGPSPLGVAPTPAGSGPGAPAAPGPSPDTTLTPGPGGPVAPGPGSASTPGPGGSVAPGPGSASTPGPEGPVAPGPETPLTPGSGGTVPSSPGSPGGQSGSPPGGGSGNPTTPSPPSDGKVVTPSIIFISGVTIVLGFFA